MKKVILVFIFFANIANCIPIEEAVKKLPVPPKKCYYCVVDDNNSKTTKP
ncbi:hypothetical protein [Campylobacter lari]|nr:hypothetical protein [Campylobacter lari]MBT0818341.1 hypothetical protein [Campylobacter lari]MBT0832811.1 hypothetical protein [Campylobacter lari]MCR6518598.1 hypothetical protein [Campylobacter lari]MCR6547442.1 hypothetical protein [Campylobacter lari]MCV3410471.1 hypothetical protein [Campylobacter lari]